MDGPPPSLLRQSSRQRQRQRQQAFRQRRPSPHQLELRQPQHRAALASILRLPVDFSLILHARIASTERFEGRLTRTSSWRVQLGPDANRTNSKYRKQTLRTTMCAKRTQNVLTASTKVRGHIQEERTASVHQQRRVLLVSTCTGSKQQPEIKSAATATVLLLHLLADVVPPRQRPPPRQRL